MSGKWLTDPEARIIEAGQPDLFAEWDQWLRDNFDPGHWDAYKDKTGSIVPYVGGKAQWTTDTFMPDHLIAKLHVITLPHALASSLPDKLVP